MPISVAHDGNPPAWLVAVLIVVAAVVCWGVIVGLGMLLALIA